MEPWPSSVATPEATCADPGPGDTGPDGDRAEGVGAPVEGRLVILTRAGCHLCEEAVAVARAVGEVEPVLVDVDEDPALRRRWGDHVPVTFVDGVLIAYWHLPRTALVAALAGHPEPVGVRP